MRSYFVAAIAIIGICVACFAEGEATAKDFALPMCEWIKPDTSASGIRVAQIDHCCVGSMQCPDGNTYECAYACNTPLDNCTGILIRGGYHHIAFDGYTPGDCIAFILSTPWCSPTGCP